MGRLRQRNGNSGDSSFVYQPGGKAGGNVYITEAALKAEWDAVAGPKVLLVDDTIAPAHFAIAGWNIDQATIRPNFLGSGTLIWDTGATMVPPESVWLEGGLIMQSQNTTAPVCTYTAGTFGAWYVSGDTTTIASAGGGAQPFFRDSASGLAIFTHDTSQLGDGAHNMMTTDAGQSSSLFTFDQTSIKAHACGGLGTVTVSQVSSASASSTQDVTTFTIIANPPPNFKQNAGNAGTGTATVTVTTAAISKQTTGQMNVAGSILCSVSAAATLTVQLQKDGAALGNPMSIALALGATIGVSLNFVDTATDSAGHTYGLKATSSLGILTVAATSAQVKVSEGA